MPVPTLADLLAEKSKEAFFDELVQAAIDEKLSTSAWEPGEPIRAAMGAFARVLAALWNFLAVPAIRAAFLDYASGGWLTLLAWTSYGVKRRGAEFATRALTVENHGPGFLTITPGQVRIKNGVTGKTFTNTNAITLAAWVGGAFPTGSLAFRADEAGTAGDTNPNEITEGAPITGPSGLYVLTNTAAILGADEEPDDALKIRCRVSMGPLSPAGPRAAYEFVALSTDNASGVPVPINRVRVVDLGGCACAVYLAGRGGPTTGDMATADSDVGLVYNRLLKLVVPFGFTCTAFGAGTTAQTVAFDVFVDIDSGLTAEEAYDKSVAALAEYLAKVPIGGRRITPAGTAFDAGYLFTEELNSIARASAPGIVRVTSSMAGDLSIPYNHIPDIAFDVTVSMVKQ